MTLYLRSTRKAPIGVIANKLITTLNPATWTSICFLGFTFPGSAARTRRTSPSTLHPLPGSSRPWMYWAWSLTFSWSRSWTKSRPGQEPTRKGRCQRLRKWKYYIPMKFRKKQFREIIFWAEKNTLKFWWKIPSLNKMIFNEGNEPFFIFRKGSIYRIAIINRN